MLERQESAERFCEWTGAGWARRMGAQEARAWMGKAAREDIEKLSGRKPDLEMVFSLNRKALASRMVEGLEEKNASWILGKFAMKVPLTLARKFSVWRFGDGSALMCAMQGNFTRLGEVFLRMSQASAQAAGARAGPAASLLEQAALDMMEPGLCLAADKRAIGSWARSFLAEGEFAEKKNGAWSWNGEAAMAHSDGSPFSAQAFEDSCSVLGLMEAGAFSGFWSAGARGSQVGGPAGSIGRIGQPGALPDFPLGRHMQRALAACMAQSCALLSPQRLSDGFRAGLSGGDRKPGGPAGELLELMLALES